MGRPRLQYLKHVNRNTAADSYTAMKEWLATNPDGMLPTNQNIEGYEEEEEQQQQQQQQQILSLY